MRLALHLLAFLAILVGVVMLTDQWKWPDYFLYEKLYVDRDALQASPRITIVDIPHPTLDNPDMLLADAPPVMRGRIAEFLTSVRDQLAPGIAPQAIVLDYYFFARREELGRLQALVSELYEAGVPVYGIFDVRGHKSTSLGDIEKRHALDLYRVFEGGYLHTLITPYAGVLTYAPEIQLRGDGMSSLVTALPVRLAEDLERAQPPEERTGFVLPFGHPEAFAEQTWVFRASDGGEVAFEGAGGGRSASLPVDALDDRVLVVGSLATDQPIDDLPAGPLLLAWAIDDQLRGNTNAIAPLDGPVVLIGQVIGFSALTAAVYGLLFAFVPVVRRRPLSLAPAALAVSVLCLVGYAMLVLAAGRVALLTLTLVGMVVAAWLAHRFAYPYLVVGVGKGRDEWDVFISYSRKDAAWVEANLYEPLSALTKADGTPLKVFFDQASIPIGEQFTVKYMWDVVDSRYFIPFFSGNYYAENSHCRNEMDLAYKLKVEGKLEVLPLMKDLQTIPEIFATMNFVDVELVPNYLDELRRRLASS